MWFLLFTVSSKKTCEEENNLDHTDCLKYESFQNQQMPSFTPEENHFFNLKAVVTLHSCRHKKKWINLCRKGQARDCTWTVNITERQSLDADQLSWCRTIYQTKWKFRGFTVPVSIGQKVQFPLNDEHGNWEKRGGIDVHSSICIFRLDHLTQHGSFQATAALCFNMKNSHTS